MNTTVTFEQRYVQARRRFIEADFANLNDMQRKAVLATEGPLLLLAGAGSGKTTVLIHRIANLIQYGRGSDTDEVPDTATEADLALLERTDLTPDERRRAQRAAALEPVEPWRIIAITFTNKAADELKDRIERMLGPEAAADIWASTFHSACVRILRRDADKLGYPNSFTIYDTSDSQAVVKRILKEMNLDEKAFPYRAVLTEISRAKDSGITPEQYLARAQATHNPRSIRIGEVYQTYWQRLFSAGAMDFDDLIYNTVRLLDEHEDVREHWQRRFRYVLIDEYQDTNNLQYQLAALLADGWGNICVVGDDDQSIYKFRGATIENILNFEKQYKNARTIRLEQNYRSTGRILDAANHVIANNTGRKGKTLWTKAEAGDPLTLYCATTENDEARYVATKIMDDFGHGMNFRDHAVLYRMNAQSNQLEYAFKRNGIPYRIIGGTRFFDRAEVKDMLAYLCVIQTPGDDLRLTRIINTPARGIGEPDEMEEERRLCYVALTRAREHLILTCARQRMLFGRTTANRVSRFVEEIPEEDIQKLNVPHGYGYSEPSRDQQQYPPRQSAPRAYTVSAPEPRRRPPVRPAPPAAKPAGKAAPAFAVGDRVTHRAFGSGVVSKIQPMGGDALLEVEFETAGTKRLMMRAAGQFMKKEP